MFIQQGEVGEQQIKYAIKRDYYVNQRPNVISTFSLRSVLSEIAIATYTWRCRKIFGQWGHSFHQICAAIS